MSKTVWRWLLTLQLACGCAQAAQATQVMTTDGALAGQGQDGVDVYRGIPYALPPLGAWRWRPPQPAPAWQGVRDASKFAPACMQQGVSMPGETPPEVSEDCLYLNVWAPLHRAGQRLPVIVWIHGGGYANGSASMPLYHGDRLARKGVLVVTIAYRLGALGFLAHPALSAESPHRSSGNYGLMDQIAALEWVQRNIAAFGGDPGRVTIAGQSAGAMAVSALLSSPRAKGLFQRAIAQSGGIFEPLQLAPGYLLANAERDGASYMGTLGATTLEAMRKLPAERLLGGGAGAVTHPVIEPDVLPLSPYEAYAQGRNHDVPLLLGSNSEEARALVNVTTVRADSFEADIAASVGALPPALLAAYPHATDAQAREGRLALERDLRFGWDMWAWARLAQKGRSPVYYYSFDHRPPFPADSVYAAWGASHYAELWYMFDHLDQAPWAWRAADRKLAAAMSSYWVHFAATGDPNGSGVPHWPAFRGIDGKVQRLSDPIDTGPVPALDRLQVFDAVYSGLRGKAF
ncbi:carboxylesterase/lipase family protein [Duganella sp. HH101]|uniref:carboxylesterase/lipase family protein n=1 Tax=Duganella sp. HH101 TaxID=1781066 RepID=UPI0008756D1E|nr:carboxylesterase family protein [Duganella sp. HH101]OFA04219.1 fumonisin B1 esterase [Duganella sp. HH101]